MARRTPIPIPAARQESLRRLLASLGVEPTPGERRAAGAASADNRDLAPVEEALTHSSAGWKQNHEQLEFLGDAVLRLAASEFLARRHPTLSVGQRSSLRAQMVSDRWLTEQAEAIGLAALLHLGPMAAGDSGGRATVLAECCEALVGAVYQVWGGSGGGLEAVLRWLGPAWERTSAELLADPDRHNWKTALQEWSQGRGLGLPHYSCEEQTQRHGDPRRFRAWVRCGEREAGQSESSLCSGEGWGGSRREAEQQAARSALARIRQA